MKNRFCRIARSALALLACLPSAAAQLTSFPKQDLVDYTAKSPFERLPDGRPKVPDELIERARGLSSEEVWAVLQEKEFNNQYADGFQVLHPGKTMVGRAFTVQFMPLRADDNLFFYVNQATHGGGLVVDGSVRDLNGISEIDMPAYFRFVDPTPIGEVMLTGINVPVRIQGVTVMPGDLVVGDREGVYFIPPQFVQEVLDKADETHIHDEWTKKKFAERKYKSSEIYGSPSDPQLKQEYQQYLKKRLEEIHKQRTSK